MRANDKFAFFFASVAIGVAFSAALYIVAGNKKVAMDSLWVVAAGLLTLALAAYLSDLDL